MPSRPAGNLTQDWEPVIFHRHKPNSTYLKNTKAVNSALRAGAAVETVKKLDAGLNKNGSSASQQVLHARKLDEQTEPGSFDRLPTEVRLAIMKARIAKKMSQAELAKLINERTPVVQDYESGKAIPSHAVLAKIERVLGVKLRGKNK